MSPPFLDSSPPELDLSDEIDTWTFFHPDYLPLSWTSNRWSASKIHSSTPEHAFNIEHIFRSSPFSHLSRLLHFNCFHWFPNQSAPNSSHLSSRNYATISLFHLQFYLHICYGFRCTPLGSGPPSIPHLARLLEFLSGCDSGFPSFFTSISSDLKHRSINAWN